MTFQIYHALVGCTTLLALSTLIVTNISLPLALGFTAALPRRAIHTAVGQNSPVRLIFMAPLSDEEVFARAAQQRMIADQEEQAPPPMLFDEDMLMDMQAALLLMERRVTEGPGSLSLLEVDQLNAQLSKIVTEMKQNEHKRPARPTRTEEVVLTPVGNVSPATEPLRAESYQAGPKVIDIDTPSDEGAEYNGHGGMGQAAGTRNTYIIPGMDEMSPEEYQKELQRSVIEAQAERKRSGVTGNRSTWDYLNQLTGGGPGILKAQVGGEFDDKRNWDIGGGK